MQVFHKLNPQILEYLEAYRSWVFLDRTQECIARNLARRDSRLRQEQSPGEFCSAEYLQAIDHDNHAGFPEHWFGADLNYSTVQNESAQYESSFFAEVRRTSIDLDDKLQNLVGARFCGLKAFYPENGYISWHTNWNASNYVMIFTYSPSGKGYWRHIDPSAAKSIVPDTSKLVHLDDPQGWHMKADYFGSKSEIDSLVWHCAHSSEPRITVSYLIPQKNLWENMLEEISA